MGMFGNWINSLADNINKTARLENEIEELEKSEEELIKQIPSGSWSGPADGLEISEDYGILKINGRIYMISEFQSAEPWTEYAVHMRIKENTGKSFSLGGAVAGGLIGGPIGAAAGGVLLGKKVNGSCQIKGAAADFIGVKLYFSDAEEYVPVVAGSVKPSGRKYSKALEKAEALAESLENMLSDCSMPDSAELFCSSLREIRDAANSKKNELEALKAGH